MKSDNLITKLKTSYQLADQTVKQEKKALKGLRKRLNDTKEAQSIIQKIAKGVQEEAHKQIAGVVSKCLKSVFEEPDQFQILFEEKRGRTEARLVFLNPDGYEVHPKDGAGQGQVDIAALALRLACLVLSRPARRKVLFLDEPMKNVHGEANRERAAKLIETLSKEMGVQFIIVTGLDWLRVGKIINLSE